MLRPEEGRQKEGSRSKGRSIVPSGDINIPDKPRRLELASSESSAELGRVKPAIEP